ncbi:hypothetical protein [Bacillus sp. OR-18]|uniref:hypothetical protein n=1 Tax=Bacillus sp. OR-18 TaxID=3029191 RepID=UPI00259E167D|nr:hypothetical protein [Bacillus sp. OR-18]MDM5040954.1 hypothetical protein [Bacillus sp. OR-18]
MSINYKGKVAYLLDRDNFQTDHLNPLPEKCPNCDHSVSPEYIFEYSKDLYNLSLVCGCPRKDCASLFVAEYKSTVMRNNYYELVALYPQKYKTHVYSDDIINLSNKFVEIYNQAFIAEQSGLNEICGVGYRKSLEFLVKDYAIKLNPNEVAEVKRKFLKPCIVDYIPNENVKFLAERATWLGNDETHYERKWHEKDVQDLKILIELTVKYIEMELMFQKVQVEMADGR